MPGTRAPARGSPASSSACVCGPSWGPMASPAGYRRAEHSQESPNVQLPGAEPEPDSRNRRHRLASGSLARRALFCSEPRIRHCNDLQRCDASGLRPCHGAALWSSRVHTESRACSLKTPTSRHHSMTAAGCGNAMYGRNLGGSRHPFWYGPGGAPVLVRPRGATAMSAVRAGACAFSYTAGINFERGARI